MSVNRLTYTISEHQEKITNVTIDLLYAVRLLLVDLEYDFPETIESYQVSKVKNLCDELKMKLLSKEGR